MNEQHAMRLIQDDDSHWYVIPSHMEPTFAAWCKATSDCEPWDDAREPIRVEGPHTVTFTGWQENT